MKKSKRVEFTESEKKQLIKAASIKGQSVKRFIEMAAIAATLQTLNSHV
jgi:uncharacterized protein (DUF1778 family)